MHAPPRIASALVLGLLLAPASPRSAAGFPPGTLQVCPDPDVQYAHQVCPDDSGGAIILWSKGGRLRVDRLDAAGNSRWACAPLSATVTGIDDASAIPDGAGGLFVSWDTQNPSQARYAQHIDRNGLPLWGDGVVLLSYPTVLLFATMAVADGAGGLFVVHARNDETFTWYRVALQHIGPAGDLRWGPEGLPVDAAPGAQYANGAVSDGAGGLVVSWVGGNAQRVQRFDATGQALWAPNGVSLTSNGNYVSIVPDGSHGVIAAWSSSTSATVLANRVDAAGALAWGAGGVPLVFGTGVNSVQNVVSDGSGGGIVTWSHMTSFSADSNSWISQRVDALGNRRWAANGATVSGTAAHKEGLSVTGDGQGGATFAWGEVRGSNYDLIGQRADGTGGMRWSEGTPIATTTAHEAGATTGSDGSGGAYVCWGDAWSGPGEVWLTRLASESPTTAVLSVVGAEVRDGDVHLRWSVADRGSERLQVERRSDTRSWRTLADVGQDGTGWVSFVDRAVPTGGRLGYRIGSTLTGAALGGEVWVDVPAAGLHLSAPRPNPSSGRFRVSVTLTGVPGARLELWDVRGRPVQLISLDAYGAGAHDIALAPRGRWAPGVYWLRLTQPGYPTTTRPLVLRE